MPGTSSKQLDCCVHVFAAVPTSFAVDYSSVLCHAAARHIIETAALLFASLCCSTDTCLLLIAAVCCVMLMPGTSLKQLCCCLQELRQAVMNGAEKHPGAVAVEDEFGRVVSLTAFDQQVPIHHCTSTYTTAVNGFMQQALCAVAKMKAMYALLPRYRAYLTLLESTCLMNEYMSDQLTVAKVNTRYELCYQSAA